MDCYARRVNHAGLKCVELSAGGYYALICVECGSSVLRLRDSTKDVDVFRYSDSYTGEEIKAFPEVFGLPTLYLPNRFADGVIRTSDAVYNLPVNEPQFHNHIHGFLHKREHTLISARADGVKAAAVTSFSYDESDEMFACFPVAFTAEFEFTLSESGLEYSITLTNNSDVMMPVSLATHTAFKAPFVDGGAKESIRLYIPAAERCECDSRWLCTGKKDALSDSDAEYVSGKKKPIGQVICNEMFSLTTGVLNGSPLYGTVLTDEKSGIRIVNELSPEYKFMIVWNNDGNGDFFCPEPMTGMIDAPNLDIPAAESGYSELSPGTSATVRQKFYVL